MILRERISKIFGSRLFYIIFSLLASITVWLYVAYIDNDDVPWNVKNIKIELLNPNTLADRNLIITNQTPELETIQFIGKRNTVTQLSNSNVTVSVDLAEITQSGYWQLNYDINYPDDINPDSVTPTNNVNVISFNVEKLVSKEIPVRAIFDGSVAEGFQKEPLEVTPDMLTVTGPEEVLSKIASAQVMINKTEISKTYEEDLPFTLMDADGHEVVSDMVEFSSDTIHVVIPINMIKDIPLIVDRIDGAGTDETNTVISITPLTIKVAGDAETLAKTNSINLGAIDLTKFLTTMEFELPIVLPDNTENLTGVTSAKVSVSISGLESTHITAENIQTTNVPDGSTATIVTQSLDILLRGKAAELAKISPSDIRIVADLSEFVSTTGGTTSVIAKVIVDGKYPSVGAIGEYKVTVTLTKS